MSFHAGQTFTFGEQPSATKWQYLWDNDYALADGTGISNDAILTRHIAAAQITPAKITNPYKFSAYATSTVGISTATQKVVLNAENFDSNNNFDSTTNRRYVAPVNGFYFFYGQVAAGSAGMGGTEYTEAALYKNGALYRQSQRQAGSGSSTILARGIVGALIQLTAGDYIELYALMGGVYRDIVGGNTVTYLEGFLVTPT